jgi:hypothetical protein
MLIRYSLYSHVVSKRAPNGSFSAMQVVKLTLLYGILSLRKQYGPQALAVQDLKDIVGEVLSTITAMHVLIKRAVRVLDTVVLN